MRLPTLSKLAFAMVALYVILLSLMPIASSLLRGGEWIGLERGAYYYRNNKLEVRLTGYPEGWGKPRIYIYAPNASYRPILFIEFDDRESTVNGLSLYHDSMNVTLKSQDDFMIMTYYLQGNTNVRKVIAPREERVEVGLESEAPVEYSLVLRGRNCTYVNGLPVNRGSPVVLSSGSLRISFEVRGVGRGLAELNFSSPVSTWIFKDERDRCTFVVEHYGRSLSMSLRGEIEARAVSPISFIATNVVNHRLTQLLLPLVALLAVATGWLLWKRI